MSKSERERRDAERAARRAARLAQRAEQRAQRKEEQAIHAADRAERLAQRARRRPRRERDLDESIEDLVDQVTEKWTRKAGEWIDQQSNRVFDDLQDDDEDYSGERRKSKDADFVTDKKGETRSGSKRNTRGRKRRSRPGRRKRSSYSDGRGSDCWGWGCGWSKSWKEGRRGNLYRDEKNKKICGVCSGVAEYMQVETWQVRLIAVMGLVFMPTVAITVYFITYFLMDRKPYYRQVTDRFDEDANSHQDARSAKRSKRGARKMAKNQGDFVDKEPELSNQEAMRKAKDKFGDIEQRLRKMETHVTSSTFELQRELNKISGEDS